MQLCKMCMHFVDWESIDDNASKWGGWLSSEMGGLGGGAKKWDCKIGLGRVSYIK